MEEVLIYLYTGNVDINDSNAFDLMAVADYFLITSLKFFSSKFIQETMCTSNCILAYYSSVKYQCLELQEAARSFILANFAFVTRSNDFLNLSVEQVEEWISSDEIVIKGEKEVFLSVLIWTGQNAERKQSFYNLFRHVRCHHLSRNFLVTVMLQHELVRDKKECLDLVLDAIKEISDETGEVFLKRSPRNCLKNPEDAIFACGGNDGEKAMCYLPSHDEWFKIINLQKRRDPFALASTACQGKVYVLGTGQSLPYTYGATDREVERYDPLLKTWSFIKPSPQRVSFATAVAFQGLLYVIGGKDSFQNILRTVKQYDPDTDLWQDVSPLSTARCSVCVVADENYIYAIGGYTSLPSERCLDIVETFDPMLDSWNRIASTQAKRRGAAGVSLHSKVFVFGGVDLSCGCPCEVYDKDTNVWTEISSDIAPRYQASAVCVRGQIFVLGGFGVNQKDSQELTLQVYDVEKNEWKPCRNGSLGSVFYKLSAGKILKEVLHSS